MAINQPMFSKILIANRGEIARRIIRTARRLGIATVAVHSDADEGLPFVREADETIFIGGAAARESYLNQDRILEAARKTGAEAIHPGYGFLSENADFAERVEAAGLIWIGAPASAIRSMGLKDAAKALMIAAKVPVTPGYLGENQDEGHLQHEAQAIGFPVLIKAVAGGGGKGMRKVDSAREFSDALASCRNEAASAFGDNRVLIEKYVRNPRHIEVQVFGDKHGNIVHLFERDCSLQRRHQKVIEEAPAPGLDEETRSAICEAAVKAARAVNYVGAGTIEFIADASEGIRADRTWFMEMNTRLQVEHPVTEAITGFDLVEWQFRVAAGEPVPKKQHEISRSGWAMEARLYAEDPAQGFMPSTGLLQHLRFPQGVRVDSAVEEGCTITPHYDPMIAKVIVHAATRELAAANLTKAVAAIEVWPAKTNAAFLAHLAAHPDFVGGNVDTGFIGRHVDDLVNDQETPQAVLQTAAAQQLPAVTHDPWSALRGFRVNADAYRMVEACVDNKNVVVRLDGVGNSELPIHGRGLVFHGGKAWTIGPKDARLFFSAEQGADNAVLAPMTGRITAILVKPGDHVSKGQKLIVEEAMKMEMALHAPFAGQVEEVRVELDDQVMGGALLLTLKKGA